MNTRAQSQSGASLLVALMMLIVTMMLGVAAAETALYGAKASRNESDRRIAYRAAEAALLDAENDIQNGGTRSANFSPSRRDNFPAAGEATCFSGANDQGLCRDDPLAPAWKTADFFATAETGVDTVRYGKFTSASMQTAASILPSRLPRYIIELQLYTRPGAEADTPSYFYRVTAVGFGVRDTTSVMLQTYYRKED